MSFRDIGAIIKKVKLEVERERGQLEEKDDYDIESKSKNTQAIKLFSEGKTPGRRGNSIRSSCRRSSRNIPTVFGIEEYA